MKIAFFIDDLGIGGTQAWLKNLVPKLKEKGYEIRIYCIRNLFNKANVGFLTEFSEVKILGVSRFWFLFGFFQLFLELRQWRPDIVQTQLPTADVIGRIVSRVAGVKNIISSIRNRNKYKSSWQLFWDRRTVSFAKRIIFNSMDAVSFAQKHEGVSSDQVVYIPNGVNVPDSDINENNPFIKARKQEEKDMVILGVVARLCYQKGHSILLTAFKNLISEKRNVMLWLVGDGPFREKLEKETHSLGIASQVRFWGSCDNVAEFWPAVDLIIHPALFEGMPNAVMEAMANGKPVVASGVDAINSLIEDGENGWLVEPEKPDLLTSKILKVLEDKEKMGIVGNKARTKMQNDFSIDKMADDYVNTYFDVIGEIK